MGTRNRHCAWARVPVLAIGSLLFVVATTVPVAAQGRTPSVVPGHIAEAKPHFDTVKSGY